MHILIQVYSKDKYNIVITNKYFGCVDECVVKIVQRLDNDTIILTGICSVYKI